MATDPFKVLLVNPPIPATWYNDEFYPPSGLLYLAAVLEKNGQDVKLLDMKALKPDIPDKQKFYVDTLIKAISDFNPGIIGFGCLFSGNFLDVLRFSVVCKERFKEIPIVAGGIHFTIYAEKILENCPSIDGVFLGEAEEAIVELAETIKSRHFELDKVDGFAYRNNGKIQMNPKSNFIKNIDNIPFPAYNLINIKDYYVDTSHWHNPKRLPINTSLPIISSRSCPYRCTFCSMYTVMGPHWRGRSANNVVDEIEYLYNTYNHRHFSFMDDNFSFNKQRTLEICREIKRRNMDIQYETPNGLSISSLDKEVLDAMVSSGLVRIYLAIESGSDFIRNKIMKKNLKREKIFEVIRLTKEYPRLFVNVFFVMGMPEETQETLQDTFDMIKEIEVNKIHLMNIIPFPGTKVYEQAVRDNLLIGIDAENMYKFDNLYFKNYTHFFIKPYKLTLKELHDFRAKCEILIADQKARRQQQLI